MKLWQSISFTEPDQVFDVARICEEVGFDGVILSEHPLHFEHVGSPYPSSTDLLPRLLAQTDWPECWSLIAALATVTQRLRFLTNVYILPLRNPIEVAKASSSVATCCDGRVILGAGAGWMKEEFDVFGVDFRTRGKRFDECIAVLRKLWTGEMVEHHGRFVDFPRVQMRPAPRPADPQRRGCDHGITHICLAVADIDAEYERLRAAGMRFHCAPQDTGATRTTVGRDPDGNIIELQQVVDPASPIAELSPRPLMGGREGPA